MVRFSRGRHYSSKIASLQRSWRVEGIYLRGADLEHTNLMGGNPVSNDLSDIKLTGANRSVISVWCSCFVFIFKSP